MKALGRLIALLLTIVCAVLLTATFLLISPQGLHWAYRFAAALLPGELNIEQLDGRLRGPLQLSGIHYHNDQIDVRLARLELQWHPGELVEGRLHIEDLKLSNLHIRSTASSSAAVPAVAASSKPSLPDIRLPLTLRIDHAALHDLHIAGGGDGNAFALSSVELRNAAFRKGRLDLEQLTANAPRYQISVSGNITPQRRYPLDLKVRWTADGGDYGTLAGNGRLRGDLRKIDIQQQLTSPLRAELRGAITDPLHDLGWQGEVSWPTVDLHSVHAAWPALSVAGKVHGSGNLNHVEAEGEVRSGFDGFNGDHRFLVDYDHGRNTLAVRRLVTTLRGSGAVLSVHGTISQLDTTPRAALAGDWKDLRWPLRGEAIVASQAGGFSISGGLDDYRVQLNGDLGGPQVPTATLALDAAGGKDSLTISRAAMQLLGGTLDASGHVDWLKAPQWNMNIQGRDLDPGQQWARWPGKLALTAQVAGGMGKNGVRTVVKLTRLHGELKAVPLDADGALSIRGDRLHLRRLRIDSGGNRLTAAGTVTDQWNLAWQINAGDLGKLVPNGTGRLQGSGYLTGPRRRPTVTASLSGQQLHFAATRIGALSAVVAVDSTGRLPSTVEIEAHDADFADQHFDAIRLRGDGTLRDHRAQLSIAAPAGRLTLALSGGYAHSAWHGSMKRLDLDTPAAGRWRLAAATPLSFTAGGARLQQFCLQQDQSRICAAAQFDAADDWQLQTAIHALPLQLFQQWLPAGSTLSGQLDGKGRFGATPGAPLSGGLNLTLSAGKVGPATLGANKPTAEIAFRGGEAQVTLDAQALAGELHLDLADDSNVRGSLRIARDGLPAPLGGGHTDREGTLSGQLQAKLRDLGLLPAFIPGIEHTQGSLSSTLSVAGSWQHPRLSGELHLENGAAVIPALGINPEAIDVVVRGDAQGRLSIDARLRSKGGSLKLAGTLQYTRSAGWNIQTRLSGERAEIANTPEYHILASPDLKLSVKGHRIDVEGDLVLPEANLRPRDVSGAVSPSADVVIVNAQGTAPPEPRWQIYANVHVRLGDFVKFNGFGLSGLLNGDFTLSDVPQKPTVARGELSIVHGEYRAYGQKLTVDRGRLLFFGGPVDNPGLDIRAVRKIQDVTAGILVRGTIKAPQVQLFSEPAMAETDALSYLLTGQPINQATTSQGQQLYGAALSLGLAGSGLLANQIGQRFGIDQVQVESGGSFGSGALVIRHYLSPRLYISYGVGLIERFNLFLMRYQISRLWALEAESGPQSGADLVYTLERK